MELKRVLTKRMRMRKANAPDSIELPANKFSVDSSTPSTPSGYGAPATPTTPSIQEFVSIPFDEHQQSSPRASPRKPSSARSSRSPSLSSSLDHSSSPSYPSADADQPVSPASICDGYDSDADEMAQQILEKVQQGGQNWCL